jgi:hypothetical protein
MKLDRKTRTNERNEGAVHISRGIIDLVAYLASQNVKIPSNVIERNSKVIWDGFDHPIAGA